VATTVHNDIEASFLVQNSAAVDPASLGAVAAANQDYAVKSMDGSDTAPLKSGDTIVVIPPATLEAGITIQGAVYKNDSTVTVRFTNGSAGAIDMASQAIGAWKFVVHRR